MSPRCLRLFPVLAALCAAPAGAAPPPGEAAAFCGVAPSEPVREEAISCKLPGLPCGPLPQGGIRGGGVEPQEDLDGDGRLDIVMAGRREQPRRETYGIIYRATPAGFVLADYHAVAGDAEPTMASVALPGEQLKGPPLIRDGWDLPPSEGNTLSMARLRRWDGHRFRTLLTFCANRSARAVDRPRGLGPEPPGAALAGGQETVREGHNRVEFMDVDKDGTPEVILQGSLRAVVYRLVDGGLGLREDPALTARFREQSPAEQKARALLGEAGRLLGQGQWRRAASVLARAQEIAPYNVDVKLRLAAVHVKLDEPARAVAVLLQAQALAPERGAIPCALAEAYRKAGDDDEAPALDACIDKATDPAQRKAAEERRKALAAEQAPDGGQASPPASAPPPASAQPLAPHAP